MWYVIIVNNIVWVAILLCVQTHLPFIDVLTFAFITIGFSLFGAIQVAIWRERHRK